MAGWLGAGTNEVKTLSLSGNIFGAGTILAVVVAAVWWALAVLVPVIPPVAGVHILAIWVLLAVVCFLVALGED